MLIKEEKTIMDDFMEYARAIIEDAYPMGTEESGQDSIFKK